MADLTPEEMECLYAYLAIAVMGVVGALVHLISWSMALVIALWPFALIALVALARLINHGGRHDG